MVKIRIGIRRLFEAVECSIAESGILDVTKTLPDVHFVRIYLGPKPLFGIHTFTGAGKYLILNPLTCMGNLGPYKPLSNPPDGFFTEIICCREIEISDEDYDLLKKNNNTISTKLFENIHREKYHYLNEINWYAGLIGMRIHRQFVTEPIVEQPLICNTDWSYLSAPCVGPWIEQIFKIPIPKAELPLFEKILESHPGQEFLGKYGIAFELLLRAWTLRGRDRFIALFIPLEIAINSLNLKVNTHNSELIEELRKSCSNSELVEAVKGRIETWRASLRTSFEFIAERFKLDGWEKDIEAFSKFNRMRNDLLHGNSLVISEMAGEDDEATQLEDLVERYLCRIIFGDANLYKSFIRGKKLAKTVSKSA